MERSYVGDVLWVLQDVQGCIEVTMFCGVQHTTIRHAQSYNHALTPLLMAAILLMQTLQTIFMQCHNTLTSCQTS